MEDGIIAAGKVIEEGVFLPPIGYDIELREAEERRKERKVRK